MNAAYAQAVVTTSDILPAPVTPRLGTPRLGSARKDVLPPVAASGKIAAAVESASSKHQPTMNPKSAWFHDQAPVDAQRQKVRTLPYINTALMACLCARMGYI